MNKFNFKKKYGQNFLIDNNVLDKIMSYLKVNSNDLIIEIGAGSGNLTTKLKKFDASIIAYEIDVDTSKYLNKITDDKTKILYKDFIKSDIKLDISNLIYKNLYIVGNLPYYITTPILSKIMSEDLGAKELVFMVQKEVADRLSAKPGSKAYGYITAYLNYRFELEKLFDVAPQCFMPPPNVESSVIRLTSHTKYSSKNEEKLFTLLSEAFKFKRKTLLNNLKTYNKELVTQILDKHKLPSNVRAEAVSIEVFIDISNAL